MRHTLIIRPEAEEDLAAAFSWYEDKRKGLGHDFLLQVEAGMKYVERLPEAHPMSYRETRKHIIKRFPYKIIYTINRGTIVVLAILHGKRSDEFLKKRMGTI